MRACRPAEGQEWRTRQQVLAAAESAGARGTTVDAIRLLTEANRLAGDRRLEEQLVRSATRPSSRSTTSHRSPPAGSPWHRETVAPFAERCPPPTSSRSSRCAPGWPGTVACWCVGSSPNAGRESLARGIDRAPRRRSTRSAGGAGVEDTSPWYRAVRRRGTGTYRVGGRRKWVRASGAVWTVDSPRMLFQLCELLEETRTVDLVAAHLGERPALSANKCTLRRVPIDTSTNWHQDGAFLGASVRTLNLWLGALGLRWRLAGLEIVPRRLDTVLPTGTDGAIFDWSVSPDIVDDVAREAPVVTPAFRAGDALLFDHLLLHRTAVEPGMTRESMRSRPGSSLRRPTPRARSPWCCRTGFS